MEMFNNVIVSHLYECINYNIIVLDDISANHKYYIMVITKNTILSKQ